MKLFVGIVFAALLGVATFQSCTFCGPFENNADNLPNYVGPRPLPFQSYTGYVPVNSTFERYNFYWLVESQGSFFFKVEEIS